MTLPKEAEAWLDSTLSASWRVSALSGGMSTSLYRVHTDSETYVLRLYDNAEWLANEPDLCPHEAAALQQGQQSALPTPKLVATHNAGAMPLLLMTHLPGEIVVQPSDVDDWLQQMADVLVAVHRIPVSDFAWRYQRWYSLENFTVPQWTGVPEAWQQLHHILRQPEPSFVPHFIHRDYHPMNLLWDNGRISGVVDWVNACVGPIGVDVAHMRINLAQMYGIEMAARFLVAYERANTTYKHNPVWDLGHIADFAYPGPPGVYAPWLEFGLDHLTDALICQRLDEHLVAVLSALNQH